MGTEFCFLKNKNSAICHGLVFLFKLPSEKKWCIYRPWGIGHSSTWWIRAEIHLSSVLRLLLSLLQVSCWGLTWAPQALLENVGVRGLYPLVIVLFRFDDLKTKLLVEVDCRLIADLHVTEGQRKKDYDWTEMYIVFISQSLNYVHITITTAANSNATFILYLSKPRFMWSLSVSYDVMKSWTAPVNPSEQQHMWPEMCHSHSFISFYTC